MIILSFALPGMGKSSLLHDLVKAQAHAQRFIVVDHDWTWGPDAPHWRHRPGCAGEAPPDPLEETRFARCVCGASPWVAVIGKRDPLPDPWPYHGVYALRGWTPIRVAQLVVSLGWSTYVDDEIDKTARVKGWENSPLRAIVHEGRHLENSRGQFTECHVLGAARRVQNLHTDLSELADETYVGRLKGKNTLQRLLDDNTIEEDQAEKVRTLPKFQFWHARADGTGEYVKIPPVTG